MQCCVSIQGGVTFEHSELTFPNGSASFARGKDNMSIPATRRSSQCVLRLASPRNSSVSRAKIKIALALDRASKSSWVDKAYSSCHGHLKSLTPCFLLWCRMAWGEHAPDLGELLQVTSPRWLDWSTMGQCFQPFLVLFTNVLGVYGGYLDVQPGL